MLFMVEFSENKQSHVIHENAESISFPLPVLFEEMKDTMYIT